MGADELAEEAPPAPWLPAPSERVLALGDGVHLGVRSLEAGADEAGVWRTLVAGCDAAGKGQAGVSFLLRQFRSVSAL